jgi:HNH endonuclease
MKRYVSGSTQFCRICGLPIPDKIVSHRHPLFGTVDHVIPRSVGGSNKTENKVAAHRRCNMVKGNKHLLDLEAVEELRQELLPELARVGIVVRKRGLNRARDRVNSVTASGSA